ncbi:aminoglycoside phosphotransferase family protein [Kitasatospora sp. NPDC001603]|uniref:aminoglycoside phosphotransferase family protein n=1 Tax=Kitasatospora sp. NPDC001603 TaxID=3154388 RepID=UPI003321F700
MTDFAIDETSVRELLREQHPDLAGLDIRRVDAGWDNQQWRLGEELAVRIPRTERAPELLRKEREWLSVLAPRLPLPIPVHVRAGEPSALFPRPWSVVRWVPGEPADRAPIERGDHAAGVLAEFLAALHRAAPAGAFPGSNRGAPPREAVGGFEPQFHLVAADVAADVRRVWAEAVAAPDREGPPRWLHGDLHPANVVVTDGTLSGVLDFGELCAGDPAADLAAAWLLLPEGAADGFFDAYAEATAAEVDTATVLRARGWALLRCLSLIGIGLAGERGLPGGQRTWGPAGRAALARVLATG